VPPQLPLGLVQVLPPVFWIALLTAVFSVVVNLHSSSKLVYLFQLSSLSLIIIGTPVLVETNARQTDSWAHLGAVLQLLQTGLPVPGSARMTWVTDVLQTPGSFLFHAVFVEMVQPPLLPYLRIFPLISSNLFVLGYYAWVHAEPILVRKLTPILLLLSNLWLNFYFGPQSYALMLLPAVLMLVLKISERSFKPKAAAQTLVWAGLSISHLPTTATVLFVMAVERFANKIIEKKRMSLISLSLLALISIVSALLNSPAVVQQYLQSFVQFLYARKAVSQIGALVSRPMQVLSGPNFLVGSAITSFIRVASIVAGTTAALFWVVSAIRNRLYGASETLAWLLVCSLFVVATLATGQEQTPGLIAGYAVSRSLGFLFLLVPLLVTRLIFGASHRNLAIRLMSIVICLVCAISVVTVYYIENAMIVSASDLANVSFLFTNAAHRSGILATANFSPFLSLRPNLDFQVIGSGNPADLAMHVQKGSVIVFDRYSRVGSGSSKNLQWLGTAWGETPRSNRIYDSSWFTDQEVLAI
jgi:hypothetical protein